MECSSLTPVQLQAETAQHAWFRFAQVTGSNEIAIGNYDGASGGLGIYASGANKWTLASNGTLTGAGFTLICGAGTFTSGKAAVGATGLAFVDTTVKPQMSVWVSMVLQDLA